MKNKKLTLTDVVAHCKRHGLQGFPGDTIANELELKQFRTLVDGQFEGQGNIIGPDGQTLDLELLLTEQVEADLLGGSTGGNGTRQLSGAAGAHKVAIGALRWDDDEDARPACGSARY